MNQKTVLIYDQCDAGLKFAILEGDYKHLNGTYINSVTDSPEAEACQDELNKLVYNDNGSDKLQFLSVFPVAAIRDGAEVIVAGFLP